MQMKNRPKELVHIYLNFMKVFNVCKVAQRIWLPRKNQDRVSLQGGSAPRVTAIISLLSIPNEPVKVQISQDI